MNNHEDIAKILQAVAFAADKHKNQRRKGADEQPYINHPIEVAEQIVRVGKVSDSRILLAAILHDTVEDTDATPEIIEKYFGREVREIVAEVTDDKTLPKAERKQKQIKHAPHLSESAKVVKISDKISNIRDVLENPPDGWSDERRLDYLEWGENVINAGLRGVNADLEKMFDDLITEGRNKIKVQSNEEN